MTTRRKGARDCGPAPHETTSKRNHTPGSLLGKLGHAAWVAAYTVEQARQRYAGKGQLFRQAGACILLAMLRLLGVRYV